MSAAPLTSRLQDPRVLAFLLVLFGVNLLFGLGSISMAGVEQAIAWQAHIGGFPCRSPGIRRIRSHSDLDGRRPE
ncbi:MAG TPA: hypothetical protein VJS43_16635 [Candidatus Acidoferrales bacterium]|nr:hypothetical protein [Candidatus Acidoferrales bacterium]